jgi:seryl-tRNA(Sec) selenium transferase
MLESVARIAGPKNIPILVDAAAEVLTIPNVTCSAAPPSSRKRRQGDLRSAVRGTVARAEGHPAVAWQAVRRIRPGTTTSGREETLGMLAAVEAWVKRDHAAEWKTWLGWLDTISKRVAPSTA